MTPLASTRKVARSMPIYLRPYRVFSPHTPQSCAIFDFGIGAQRDLQLVLLAEFLVGLHAVLGHAQHHDAQLVEFLAGRAEKSIASLVQPEVSSLG